MGMVSMADNFQKQQAVWQRVLYMHYKAIERLESGMFDLGYILLVLPFSDR